MSTNISTCQFGVFDEKDAKGFKITSVLGFLNDFKRKSLESIFQLENYIQLRDNSNIFRLLFRFASLEKSYLLFVGYNYVGIDSDNRVLYSGIGICCEVLNSTLPQPILISEKIDLLWRKHLNGQEIDINNFTHLEFDRHYKVDFSKLKDSKVLLELIPKKDYNLSKWLPIKIVDFFSRYKDRGHLYYTDDKYIYGEVDQFGIDCVDRSYEYFFENTDVFNEQYFSLTHAQISKMENDVKNIESSKDELTSRIGLLQQEIEKLTLKETELVGKVKTLYREEKELSIEKEKIKKSNQNRLKNAKQFLEGLVKNIDEKIIK